MAAAGIQRGEMADITGNTRAEINAAFMRLRRIAHRIDSGPSNF